LVCVALATQEILRFSSLSFTIWVLVFACAGLSFPSLFTSWGGFDLGRSIVPLIQVIMLGMGTSLRTEDFVRIARMPFGVLIGIALQFGLMPLGGYAFSKIFGLEPPVALGLILVGSCPGGVSSNVITYIARGNVALSVTMTACSTMISPILTPLAMKVLAGQIIPIDTGAMMASIVRMILIPVVAGILLNRYAPRVTQYSRRWMPLVCMLSICFIIAVTIALSREELLVVGPALLGASICHNAAGFGLGYASSRMVGLNRIDSRTIAIEVGMQNGGMATGLAFDFLHSRIAALAPAVFGPWSAVAGSALASVWGRQSNAGNGDKTSGRYIKERSG
jgi:BASS family bile acid:Na+ symporter